MSTTQLHQVTVFLAVVGASFGGWIPSGAADPPGSEQPARQTAKPTPDLAAGRAAYQQSCARCHGLTGRGDGLDAKRLYPKPRDLTEGVFKFRSTASGTPPTDEDLFETVTHGLTAGGMPDWSQLDEELRWQMVYYVKSLSPVFEEVPPEPIRLGEDPGLKQVDLELGRQVYERLGCAACHGSSGRGDGSSAATLVDNWDRATRPADLTQGWNYRGESDPGAIVKRVLTGMDGTPMPSYAEAASPEDVWQLAYYVRSLQQEPHWTMFAHAAYLEGALPESPADPRWTQATRVDVRLRNAVNAAGEWTAPQTISTVSMQALQNGQTLHVRLAWHDPSEDRGDAGDAVALVLRPVGLEGDRVTLQTWPLRDAPPLDVCLWSARSPSGGLAREAISNGFEPVLQGAVGGVPRASQAVYHDGEWTLVVTRPLAPQDLQEAAHVTQEAFTSVAFAVWDGGNPGQRAVSPWIDLVLEPRSEHQTRSAHPWTAVVWAASGIVLVAGLWLVFRKRPA